MTSTTGAPAAEADTRTRLLRAAAHLFARKGIDGVRNHEIHTLAGQRNESALHYYFGNRANVVAAILAENDLAAAPLVETALPSLTSPAAVVSFLVERLAIGLGAPEGRDWLRIVSELMARFSAGTSGPTAGSAAHLRSMTDLLRSQMAPVLPDVVERRVVAMIRFMSSEMGHRARLIDDGALDIVEEREFLDELAGMSLGMLMAPAAERHQA